MKIVLGLAVLAAAANAQTVLVNPTNLGYPSTSGATNGLTATPGTVALSNTILITQTNQNGNLVTQSGGITGQIQTNNPAQAPGSQPGVVTSSYALSIPYAINTIVFRFQYNGYTAQAQYRWSPGYGFGQAYTCDPCAGGSTSSCNTSTGPGAGASPSQGFPCANINNRYFVFQSLAVGGNSFSVQLFDLQTQPGPNVSSYSFTIARTSPPIIGDPEIVGMQGQDFQVHGMPDEIFNMITYTNVQVNARFAYLSAGECIDNYTACFAHPGTYISEEGIRVGKDKVHVVAGPAAKGLTVSVNGLVVSEKTALKLGSVTIVNKRRVVVKTPVASITITNSDKFLNQETTLLDNKLIRLGASRRVLKDNEEFHPEVPLHGLQGQTWRNVEYPSGLEYQGSITDYHVVDGNLFGTDFVYNKFQL